MASTDENVRLLSNAVLSDVRGDAERIVADARQKAEELRRQAEGQAQAERAKVLERARLEAERVRGQAAAATQLQARTMELEQREKTLEAVFEVARQKLASIQKSADYEKTASMLLKESLVQLGAPAVRLRADATTRKLLSGSIADQHANELGIQIQWGDNLAGATGVIVETEDGRRQFDNTLESRLRRMQPALRAPVYKILMGEPR